MSLSSRAVAVFGVGFGATSVAVLGLWPAEPEAPAFGRPIRSGIITPDRRAGWKDDADLLEILPIIVGVLNDRR